MIAKTFAASGGTIDQKARMRNSRHLRTTISLRMFVLSSSLSIDVEKGPTWTHYSALQLFMLTRTVYDEYTFISLHVSSYCC